MAERVQAPGAVARRSAVSFLGAAAIAAVLALVRGGDSWWAVAAVLGGVAVVLGTLGLASRLRPGRFEAGAPLPPAVVDDGLGTRIAAPIRWPQLLLLAVGVLGGGSVALTSSLGSAATVLVVLGAGAGAVHVVAGRDGVWATDEHLLARRRWTVRRLPWSEVLELGVTVHDHQAQYPAARVAGRAGWTTLAKPLRSPLSSDLTHRRLRAVAAEHGVPFVDDLRPRDLVDG